MNQLTFMDLCFVELHRYLIGIILFNLLFLFLRFVNFAMYFYSRNEFQIFLMYTFSPVVVTSEDGFECLAHLDWRDKNFGLGFILSPHWCLQQLACVYFQIQPKATMQLPVFKFCPPVGFLIH